MNREKIDELLKLLTQEDENKIKQFLGIDENKELNDETFIEIAKEIEQGDYEYFISKLYDENYQSLGLLEILSYISSDKNEDKKRFIENSKEYGIPEDLTVKLIKSVNDPKFTKECIDEKEEYGLYEYSTLELIKLITDPEYIKMFIEEKEKYGLQEDQIFDLIESTNDPKFIKECIDEKEKYGLSRFQIFDLIESITDPEYIKMFIHEKEKYELNRFQIFDLIESVNDPKFTKECIDEKEKYRLTYNQIKNLIYSITDPRYIKMFIDEKEKYGLSEYQVIDLLQKIKDPEYIKIFIDEKEKYGLRVDQIFDLIESITDPEYIKMFIHEKEKYGLNDYQIFKLIVSVNDPKFTKECIAENKKYGLNSNQIFRLIKTIKDPEFTKESIYHREKYGLDGDLTVGLINSLIKNQEDLMEYLEDYKKYNFDLDIITKILEYNPQFFLSKFDEILKIYENDTMYQELIRQTLGEVELDKNNKPIIPKEIKKLFSAEIDKENMAIFTKKLPEIIAKWELIKDQIQYKKAKNLINNGLEVRGNIKEILNALQVLNRINPQTPSENELAGIPGFEYVGQDNQYTANIETAVERAFEIATEMDQSGTSKRIPDFTTEYDDIVVEVLHPQDKSAILLGYETNCCFRPNGNADNSAKDKYSLFQYCTTTPYGGVIRCKGKNDNTVHMGTPILRNGNMLMFHSYETKDGSENEKVNIALENAAKKAIELSKWKIKAVFMTNLYTGKGRLNVDRRLTISSYFRAYTEEEYEKYTEMYSNLYENNVVLAINCNGKILTGEEIAEWFKEECNGDEEVFKEKLGLSFGKVKENYEFARRKVEQEITIDNSELVDRFHRLYQEKGKERTALALIKEKKRLSVKEDISQDEEKQLIFIENELEKYPESKLYSELSESELRRKLEENEEERLNLFSGDNLRLIGEYYGITEDEINKRLEQEVEKKAKKDESNQDNISNKTKKEKSKIISQIKQTENTELISLISKIAKETITPEELEKLQLANIDTDDYVKFCINKEGNINANEVFENKKRHQIEEMKKNPRIMERVLSDMIFKNISDDEINNKIYEDTITEVKSSIYQYYKEQDEEGIITEEEKERINEKIHELNIEKALELYLKNGFSRDDNAEELMKYGISIEAIYKKNVNNLEGEKRKVKLDKFDKLKASITIGIRKKETWLNIKESISGEKEKDPNSKLEKAIFGNNWYIEYSDEEPIVYVSKDASDYEKEDLKQTLKRCIEQAKSVKEEQPEQISMESIKEVVSIVSLGDKEAASKIINEVLKETNERGEN